MAKASGLSLSQMDQAKNAGVDTKDLNALKAFRATINTRSDGKAALQGPSDDDGSRMTVEEIEQQLSRKNLTPNDARVLKLQLDGLKTAVAIKQQSNRLLSRDECREHQAKIAQALGGLMRAMENEIPALCYGKSLGEAKLLVKEKVRAIQKMFCDGNEKFWEDHPES